MEPFQCGSLHVFRFREAMRLHPAVGMPLQRVVPAGGLVIGGRLYRPGTLIGMSPLETHLDSRAYGSDAPEWRPDRWLTDDRTELEKYNLAVPCVLLFHTALKAHHSVYFLLSLVRAPGCAWGRIFL
jgi:Cytochrome P450